MVRTCSLISAGLVGIKMKYFLIGLAVLLVLGAALAIGQSIFFSASAFNGIPIGPSSWPVVSWPDISDARFGAIVYDDFFVDSRGDKWKVILSQDSNGNRHATAYVASWRYREGYVPEATCDTFLAVGDGTGEGFDQIVYECEVELEVPDTPMPIRPLPVSTPVFVPSPVDIPIPTITPQPSLPRPPVFEDKPTCYMDREEVLYVSNTGVVTVEIVPYVSFDADCVFWIPLDEYEVPTLTPVPIPTSTLIPVPVTPENTIVPPVEPGGTITPEVPETPTATVVSPTNTPEPVLPPSKPPGTTPKVTETPQPTPPPTDTPVPPSYQCQDSKGCYWCSDDGNQCGWCAGGVQCGLPSIPSDGYYDCSDAPSDDRLIQAACHGASEDQR